jgi:hypothetical protein
MSIDPPSIPTSAAAAAQLALDPGAPHILPKPPEPDPAAVQLLESLRAGLRQDFASGDPLGTALGLPAGADPFDHFESEVAREQLLQTHSPPRLPIEGDNGGPSVEDRRVALMAQDIAAFGASRGEAGPRLEDRSHSGPRFDFHA